MNLMHLKYAVSIADYGSINKAAEEIHVAQPNLSRIIKELESDLGISIFRRSSRGMELTPDGENFIRMAKRILEQVDEMEQMYKNGQPFRQRFSISVPRASYISDAFAHFSCQLSADEAEIFYQETNAQQVVRNILEVGYALGIIRYAARFDRYFKQMLEEKELTGELVSEFTYQLVMSEKSPLAAKKDLSPEALKPFIQIAHADPYVPSLPLSAVRSAELLPTQRRIYVFERGSQLDLLRQNPETFMWVSPMPQDLLDSMHLVQRTCPGYNETYRDVLIHRKDYRLTELDKCFITELTRSKRACIPASKEKS
ncbi:MAG: LysR family transcriptional regulator [Clostridia bacterium]|nr:LysR family transcriptional regulator [Clostridia bacterium]